MRISLCFDDEDEGLNVLGLLGRLHLHHITTHGVCVRACGKNQQKGSVYCLMVVVFLRKQ